MRAVSSCFWFSSICACTVASWLVAWLYFSTAISDWVETLSRRDSTAWRRALALATEPAAGAAGAETSMTATTPNTTRVAALMKLLVSVHSVLSSGVTPVG